jgi:hypothetical protein
MAAVVQPDRNFYIRLTGLKVKEESILEFIRECIPGKKVDVGDVQHEDAQRTSAKVLISGIISSEEKRLLEDGYKTVCEECIIMDNENVISSASSSESQNATSVTKYISASSQSGIMNPYILQDPATGILNQLPFNNYYAISGPSNQHVQSLQSLSSPHHASPLPMSGSSTASLPPMGNPFVPYPNNPGVSLPIGYFFSPHPGSQSTPDPRMVSHPLVDGQLVTASQPHSLSSAPIPGAQVNREDSLIDLDPCPISGVPPQTYISSEGHFTPETLQDIFIPDKYDVSHQPRDLTTTLSPATVQMEDGSKMDTSVQSLQVDESHKSTDELVQISDSVDSHFDDLPTPSFLEELWTSVTSTSTVKVESTNALNKDDLQMVFEIEDDGGGEIEPKGITVEPGNRTAFVSFKDISVAQNVAEKGKWDVMGVSVHVTLHSKEGTPVKDVLKKVVYEPHTTVVVGNISNNITEEYLRTYLTHHTGLTFYQMQNMTTISDDSDDSESSGSSVHEEYNACLFVSHPLALVVLSSNILKRSEYQSIIELYFGHKLIMIFT